MFHAALICCLHSKTVSSDSEIMPKQTVFVAHMHVRFINHEISIYVIKKCLFLSNFVVSILSCYPDCSFHFMGRLGAGKMSYRSQLAVLRLAFARKLCLREVSNNRCNF